MIPTEEHLTITIEAILGFYPTGDAERDRRSAAVIARALLDELDIDRIEREAYERGMRDAVELDEWGKSKLFYRKGYGDGAASLQIVTSTTTGRMPKDER